MDLRLKDSHLNLDLFSLSYFLVCLLWIKNKAINGYGKIATLIHSVSKLTKIFHFLYSVKLKVNLLIFIIPIL